MRLQPSTARGARRRVGQVADDDLGTEAAQFLRAIVLSPHEGANLLASLVVTSQQQLGDVAADRCPSNSES